MGLRLRQALGTLPRLIRNPYDIEADVELFDALARFGPVEYLYGRMVAALDEAEAARLARLTAEPVDLERLRALPEGTLGRAYADWLARHDLAPDYYIRAYPPSRAAIEANWVMLRFAKTHDLHHLLLGVSPAVPDEAALQIFNLLNFGEPYGAATILGFPWLLWVYRRHGVGHMVERTARLLPWARRLPNLFVFPFELHLAEDLEALRRRFGLPAGGLLA